MSLNSKEPSEQLLAYVKNHLAYSPQPAFVKDKNFCYHYVNDALLTQLNLTKEEILHKSDTQMYYAQYAHFYNTHDALSMQEKIFYQLDYVFTKEGEKLFGLQYKLPLKEADGTICGSMGYCKYMDYENLIIELNLNRQVISQLEVNINLREIFQDYINLSKREWMVLYQFLLGKSAKVIASALDISERTVVFHLNNIKEKWKCHSREDIFNQSHTKGLIIFAGIWDLISNSSPV